MMKKYRQFFKSIFIVPNISLLIKNKTNKKMKIIYMMDLDIKLSKYNNNIMKKENIC